MKINKKIMIVEEVFNAITHGIGTILSIAGFIVLLLYSIKNHNISKIVSFSIFGILLIFMFLNSTLFHSFMFSRAKKVFRLLDRSTIFLFIAGTYTPFLVLGLKGFLSYFSLITIWIMAIVAVIITIFKVEKQKLTLMLYLILGWMIVFILKPLSQTLTINVLVLLFAGGILYTGGVYFFVKSKYIFNHLIWHLFVLGGSIFHFTAMFYL